MKLFLDENLSPAHAKALRQMGFDVLTVVEAGLGGVADEKVRDFAIEEQRTLVTLDGDLANILRFPPAGTPGIIRLRIYPPIEDLIEEGLRMTFAMLKETDPTGCLIISDGKTVRIRK